MNYLKKTSAKRMTASATPCSREINKWDSNILIYIQQDTKLYSLFYLETVLHVSGGTTTHHQERKQLYLQHVVFVRPLLLPAATHHQERKQLYLEHLVFVRPLLLPAV